MRLNLLILTITITLLGCQNDTVDSDKDIYVALFNYLSQSISDKPAIVISDKAVNIEVINPTQLKNMLPATSIKLRTRFIEKLKSGGNLNKLDIPVSTKLKPIFVKSSELDAIFDNNLTEAWEKFPTKYSGAKSLVRLSLPAIDSETDTAIIYAGIHCGELCGQGYIFLLVKLKGKWTVVHMHNVWIS